MIIASIILAVAVIALAVMLYNKKVELATGKGFIRFCDKRDAKLSLWWNHVCGQVSHITRRSALEKLHEVLVTSENFFLGLFMKLGKRFHKIGDMVRGKDLPKNRGSASLFLQDIAETVVPGQMVPVTDPAVPDTTEDTVETVEEVVQTEEVSDEPKNLKN